MNARRHKRFLFCSALSSLFLVSTAAHAVTYSVGPTRMYTNLGAVASRLAPGDIVEVDGGTTYTGGVRFTVHGTEAAPIRIRGLRSAAGARPVLSGGANTVELAGNNYVLEGFDITGGTSRCVFHHADNITIRDSVVHDCPRQGILGADADSGDLLLEYVEVHHCGGGTQDHQIYMATDEAAFPGSVFRMQFCYVHDGNGGNSVKSRAERNEIYYNWIEGGLYHELELIGIDPGGGGDPMRAREDSDVVGNVLFKRNTFFVVRVGGDGTGASRGRYRFMNNTFVMNAGGSAAFRVFDELESIEAHNNAFVRLGGGGGIQVMRTAEAVWVAGREIFTGTNNWIPTASTMVPAGWTGTLQATDPRLVNPAMNQVEPAMGSPLINAGVRSTTSPMGYAFPRPLAAPMMLPPVRTLLRPGAALARNSTDGIDIGAFEFATGTPPTDAGVDAALPIDVMPPRDVQTTDVQTTDVQTIDVQPPRDVVVPPDAPPPMETSVPDVIAVDNVVVDTPSMDVSNTEDTGTDAQLRETSTASDGSMTANPDGGGTTTRPGCGCRTTETSSPRMLTSLFVLMALMWKRSRHPQPPAPSPSREKGGGRGEEEW